MKIKIPQVIPIKRNSQLSGIKKNGSINVPSVATSEPIALKESHPMKLVRMRTIGIMYFFIEKLIIL